MTPPIWPMTAKSGKGPPNDARFCLCPGGHAGAVVLQPVDWLCVAGHRIDVAGVVSRCAHPTHLGARRVVAPERRRTRHPALVCADG